MKRVCIGIHFYCGVRLLESTIARLRGTTPPAAALVILADAAAAASLLPIRSLRNVPQILADGAQVSEVAFDLLGRASDADFLVFLTQGTLLAAHWLEEMLGALQDCSGIGMVLGAIDPTDAEGLSASDRPVLLLRREVAVALGPVAGSSGLRANWIHNYCARAKEGGFGVARTVLAAQFRSPDTPAREQAPRVRVTVSPERPPPPAPIRPMTQPLCAVGPRVAKEVDRPPLKVSEAPAGLQLEPITWSSPALPLVSCIMPTRDRPAYVRQSIRYFERQTYPERELIILDDGLQPLAGEIPIHPQIRCVRGAPGQSVGAKRNQGCELARGTIIAHWDDDDWYGADRLRAQVEPLLQNVAEITALRETTFFNVDRWEFWKCSPQEHQRLFLGDVHGGTLVYFRHVWEHLAHYPCVSLAEDAAFLRQALKSGARMGGIPSEGLFLYLRHASNTWSLNANMFRNASRWQRLAEPSLPLEDRAFYEKRCKVTRETCA